MSPSQGSLFTRTRWRLDGPALPAADHSAFHSMEGLLQLPMAQVTLDRRSGVSRLCLAGNYYVKTFGGRGNRLKHLLGISRYQRELRNLQYFQSLGLHTPALIAHGEQSTVGLLQRAVMVTEEVTGTTDLEQILSCGELYRDGVKGARKVLSRLARAARLLHADGFYHKDLKPRNVLVRYTDSDPELFFFDCPSGHHPPRLMLRRGIVRDLAHLEDGLRGYVRRVDLLYMYQQYRACDRLSEQDKTLARDALTYYAKRRMTRKRRRREAQKAGG
jgi:tRNA A-37 threonylcarbamoyl transferase component Bud32